mmetsp:Transcript_76075/g.226737  ORF Transcript_76075/g.226737 Transcript_76075/m.226737 type:complete len:175 (-) Transcript_76075:169-693(-)
MTAEEPLVEEKKERLPMSDCEKIAAALTVVYWVIIGCFGVLTMKNNSSHDHDLGLFDRAFIRHVCEGWVMIYIAMLGIYMAWREVFMDIGHMLAALGLDVLQFLQFLTAGAYISAGSWSDEKSKNFNMFLTSFCHMVALLGIFLGVTHLVLLFLRQGMRERKARYDRVLREGHE